MLIALLAQAAPPAIETANPWVGPAIVAAIVSGVVGLVTVWLSQRKDRLDRQRQLFAEAYDFSCAYREFPYVVRRKDGSAEDRKRISTALNDVQQALNKHVALLRVEEPTVGAAYQHLVAETRRVAGAAIRDGWDVPAIDCDTAMHVTDVDLGPLEPAELAYLTAVKDHLALAPAWLRRAVRRLTSQNVSHPRGSVTTNSTDPTELHGAASTA